MDLRKSICLLTLLLALSAHGDEWAGDYPIGAELPSIEAPDHTGEIRTSNELGGEHGTVFFFNRSTSW